MLDKIETKERFEEAISSDRLTVIHFSAGWAEQCAQVSAVLEALAARTPAAAFLSCDAERLASVSLRHGVEAVPTVLLFRGGAEVGRVEGADPARLAAAVGSAAGGPDARLRALVASRRVMLFMKGSPEAPRCGFSRRIVEELRAAGAADFGWFDVLGDDAVRQGLKALSDWPTFPQLYVGGELVGGLDVVREMAAAGELAAALRG